MWDICLMHCGICEMALFLTSLWNVDIVYTVKYHLGILSLRCTTLAIVKTNNMNVHCQMCMSTNIWATDGFPQMCSAVRSNYKISNNSTDYTHHGISKKYRIHFETTHDNSHQAHLDRIRRDIWSVTNIVMRRRSGKMAGAGKFTL